jgi:hypothetical protein
MEGAGGAGSISKLSQTIGQASTDTRQEVIKFQMAVGTVHKNLGHAHDDLKELRGFVPDPRLTSRRFANDSMDTVPACQSAVRAVDGYMLYKIVTLRQTVTDLQGHRVLCLYYISVYYPLQIIVRLLVTI